MLATTQPLTLHFRSTLTYNGQRRPLPTRAEEFLRHDGAVLAAVLRSEIPLSINAIITACHEYAAEHPETAVGLTDQALPTLLTRFVFWGLAEAVPQPIGDCP